MYRVGNNGFRVVATLIAFDCYEDYDFKSSFMFIDYFSRKYVLCFNKYQSNRGVNIVEKLQLSNIVKNNSLQQTNFEL